MNNARSPNPVAIAKTDVIFLIFISGIFVILFLLQLNKPFGPQELTTSVIPAKQLYLEGTPGLSRELPHPPLYLHWLALSYRYFGLKQESARISGLFCSLLVLWLSYKYYLSFLQRKNARLALVFLALSPAFIQGSLVVFLDTTVLTLFMNIFLFEFIRKMSVGRFSTSLYLGGLLIIACWCKLIAPLIFLTILPIYFFLCQESGKSWVRLGVIIVSGVGGFLITFFLYCVRSGVSFLSPFSYLWEGVILSTGKTNGWLVSNFPVQFIQLVFWWGPLLFLLFMYSFMRRFSAFTKAELKIPEPVDLVALYVITVLGVYFVAGGLSYGFPQWQSVALPAFCLLAAKALQDGMDTFNIKRVVPMVLSILLVAAFFVIFAGDPIWTIRYETRKIAALGEPLSSTIIKLGWQLFIFSMPVFLFLISTFLKFTSKNLFFCLIAVFCLGYEMSLAFIHIKARATNTSNAYGITGTRDVTNMVRRYVKPEEAIIATREVIGELKFLNVPFVDTGLAVWEDMVLLKKELQKQGTRVFCYSFLTNTVLQYQQIIRDKELQTTLKSGFKLYRIGEYWLWIREDN